MEQSQGDFFSRVWDVVAHIPVGSVATYGDIASYLGSKQAARTVGWALQAAKGKDLPCHRVVNRFGGLSGAKHFGGAEIMELMLRSEGVGFDDSGCVLIDQHRWIPARSQIIP